MLHRFLSVSELLRNSEGSAGENCQGRASLHVKGSFSNVLLKCNNFLSGSYDVSCMGRKPKARRDSYGAWLYHLRKEKGLTQEELAAVTSIPQRTIAHWERTGKLAGRKEVLALSKALGVSVGELLRREK